MQKAKCFTCESINSIKTPLLKLQLCIIHFTKREIESQEDDDMHDSFLSFRHIDPRMTKSERLVHIPYFGLAIMYTCTLSEIFDLLCATF